jgi:SAM-dependent methyltransferase
VGPEEHARERGGLRPDLVSTRWDAEYRQGRYVAEPPLPFVAEILAAVRAHPAARAGVGLYVGCGNGRNYLPLVDAGLNLRGLDVSREALAQLTDHRPDLASRLACVDFRDLDAAPAFDYLIALQVFQHGRDADAATYFVQTSAVLRTGGLFFLRVNSASTEVYFAHTVVERNRFGGFTIRYDEGPKAGLPVHFYTAGELHELTRHRFRLLAEPREVVTEREAPKTGTWAQWEAVWQNTTATPANTGVAVV